VPDQEPLEPFNVEPWLALPVTVGRVVSEGGVAAEGEGATAGVCAEVANLEPDEFVAVTTTRMVLPTSLDMSRYVGLFAPETEAHPEPLGSQRRHWYA
jgi:hypothetical protein